MEAGYIQLDGQRIERTKISDLVTVSRIWCCQYKKKDLSWRWQWKKASTTEVGSLGEKKTTTSNQKTGKLVSWLRWVLAATWVRSLSCTWRVTLSWKNIAISRTAIRSSFLAQEISIRKDTLIYSIEGSKRVLNSKVRSKWGTRHSPSPFRDVRKAAYKPSSLETGEQKWINWAKNEILI